MVDKDPGKQPPDKSLQAATAVDASARHMADLSGQDPGNQALKQLFSAVGTPGSELQLVFESEDEELDLEKELEPATVSKAILETTTGCKQTTQK